MYLYSAPLTPILIVLNKTTFLQFSFSKNIFYKCKEFSTSVNLPRCGFPTKLITFSPHYTHSDEWGWRPHDAVGLVFFNRYREVSLMHLTKKSWKKSIYCYSGLPSGMNSYPCRHSQHVVGTDSSRSFCFYPSNSSAEVTLPSKDPASAGYDSSRGLLSGHSTILLRCETFYETHSLFRTS